MSGDRIFTWGDDFTKAEMRDFVKHLRATGGRRWVPILDPVVRAQRGYAPFDEAASDGGIFIKGADGKPYLGQVRERGRERRKERERERESSEVLDFFFSSQKNRNHQKKKTKKKLAQMWPGAVHWPDFLENPATQRWWTRWLRQVREDVGAIDGVWLDMNEVRVFFLSFFFFFFEREREERKGKKNSLKLKNK